MTRLLILIAALLASACGANYSTGDRIGVVTKLSNRGLIFKSWEGEMLVALPAGVSAIQPEKFEFNVNPSAVPKVQAAMQNWRDQAAKAANLAQALARTNFIPGDGARIVAETTYKALIQ